MKAFPRADFVSHNTQVDSTSASLLGDGPPSRRVAFAALGCTLVILAASAWYRARQPDFHRGLGTDEFITLQNYTWAGVNSDGTRRQLSRLQDIRDLKTPSPRQLLIGLYCSLGRWTEPNNHVVYSSLANGTLPLFDDKVFGLRLTALAAGAAFALAVAAVCWRCRWHGTAILAGTMAFWHPYVVAYSQEARGYTVMLFLIVVFLWACQKTLQNPTSIVVAFALVMSSVLIFENTVNMAVDWVIPGYVLVFAFPSLFDPPQGNDHSKLQRKSLLVQFLCVGVAGFIFLVDRLPYVVASSQQYGIPFGTMRGFFDLLLRDLHYLFPSPAWVVVAVLGGIGAILAWQERPGRGYVALSGFAMLATLLHFAAGKRFAYERNLGFWLVPVFLGYACLSQRLMNLPRHGWQKIAVAAVVYVGTLALLVPGLRTSVMDLEYETFRTRIRELPQQEHTPSLALFGEGIPDSIQLDWPANWSDVAIPTDRAVNLLLVEKGTPLLPWVRGQYSLSDKQVPDWPHAEIAVHDGLFTVVRWPCRVMPWQSQPPARAVMLWYPSFESVAVSPEKVLAFLAENNVSLHPVTTRYQAKMEVFGRLACVVTAGSTRAETERIWQTLERAKQRFGGQTVLLGPRDNVK